MDKGVITAGFCRWLKTSQSRLKRKDILHVYVIQGDNEGEKAEDIQFDGDKEDDNTDDKEDYKMAEDIQFDGDSKDDKEPDNKEGDKMRASEQLSLSSASEQLFVKPEQYEV